MAIHPSDDCGCKISAILALLAGTAFLSATIKYWNRMTTGPIIKKDYPNYVKPHQFRGDHGRSQATSVPYIEVQLISPNDDDQADIQYRITDEHITGKWHDKKKKSSENDKSTLFTTAFAFTGGINDIAVTTLTSGVDKGEVEICGHDANNNGSPRAWTSHNNNFPDDDTTWTENP
jgi:hypothetical protein